MNITTINLFYFPPVEPGVISTPKGTKQKRSSHLTATLSDLSPTFLGARSKSCSYKEIVIIIFLRLKSLHSLSRPCIFAKKSET